MPTRSLSLTLLLSALLTGCSRPEDSTPSVDLAAQVAGTYKVIRLIQGTQYTELPTGAITADLRVEKGGSPKDLVTLSTTITTNGVKENFSGDFRLEQPAGSSGIYFMQAGVPAPKQALLSENQLVLNLNDGTLRALVATK